LLAALIAQEEAELGGVKQVKKVKKKGKDDFDLLNAALAATPKTKAQKDAELKKKIQEDRVKSEEAAREAKEARLKVCYQLYSVLLVVEILFLLPLLL
jgi:hypothetical protein